VADDRPARIDLSVPRTWGELLAATIDIFRRHADVLLTLAVILVTPATLLVDGVWGGALADGVDAKPSIESQAVSAGLSLFVILPLVTASAALIVRGLGEGDAPTTAGDALRAGLRAFPHVLAAVLTYVVVVFAGFLLFVIPGIWLAVRCYFAAQVAALEGLGPSAALRRSADVVKGQWWRTAACLLATGLLFGIGGSIVIGALGATGSGALYVAGITVVEAIAVSLTATFATLLFFDLRVRKEGRPLGDRPERMTP
jgi:hypothetical protein